ncbi:MAG: hypothetical protein LC620_03235, partial [Halobacteriales archaeon]|nr:hypothetical protein [Halobacteriales archaeon]
AVLFARPFSAGCDQPVETRTDTCLQAVENPQDVNNVYWYIALILAFTFAILLIAKYGKKWVIRAIILGAVAVTIAYVAYPLASHASVLPHAIVGTPSFGYLDAVALGLAAVVAGGATLALYKHPEWYVIDTVGLLVAAASAAIFGISFGILPVLVLLALLAIYDAIAVYRTKHMLALADSVIELRLPVLLVIPKHRGYHFREEASKFKQASAANKAEREAMFMGLGDLVMPTMLVVSALTFGPHGAGSGLSLLLHTPAALGAAVGTLAGFGLLMTFVLRGNPQAGLPLLNGGAIVGFLAGLYAATGSVKFW